MIARAKNIWATLVFALGRGCNREAELDETGQQQLAQHLSWLAEAGFEAGDITRHRREMVTQRHQERFLASSDAEAEQNARRQTEANWRTSVYDNRKSIRLKFYSTALLALLSIDLKSLKSRRARDLGDLCSLFALVLLCLLLVELDETGRDAECEEILHRSLAARAAGDWRASAEFLLRYNEESTAKSARGLQILDRKVELLTRQIHHESRN